MRVAYFESRLRGPCGHHKDVSHKYACCVRGKVIYPAVTDLCNPRDVANPLSERYLSVRGSVLGEGCSSARPVSLTLSGACYFRLSRLRHRTQYRIELLLRPADSRRSLPHARTDADRSEQRPSVLAAGHVESSWFDCRSHWDGQDGHAAGDGRGL